MFVIKPTKAIDLQQAIFILSFYQVKYHSISDGEDPGTAILVVDKENKEGDLYLAEMAFQMNFRQVGNVCPVCKEETGERVCGHLTFSSFVGESFLD